MRVSRERYATIVPGRDAHNICPNDDKPTCFFEDMVAGASRGVAAAQHIDGDTRDRNTITNRCWRLCHRVV
jgi:hypothetical protein